MGWDGQRARVVQMWCPHGRRLQKILPLVVRKTQTTTILKKRKKRELTNFIFAIATAISAHDIILYPIRGSSIRGNGDGAWAVPAHRAKPNAWSTRADGLGRHLLPTFYLPRTKCLHTALFSPASASIAVLRHIVSLIYSSLPVFVIILSDLGLR